MSIYSHLYCSCCHIQKSICNLHHLMCPGECCEEGEKECCKDAEGGCCKDAEGGCKGCEGCGEEEKDCCDKAE